MAGLIVMESTKMTDTRYSCGDFDSGGVHINSGIPNRIAFLVEAALKNTC
jgi:Zn-dependent metalloprotease